MSDPTLVTWKDQNIFQSQIENYFWVVRCLGLSIALGYLAALSHSGGMSGAWPSSLPQMAGQAECAYALTHTSCGPSALGWGVDEELVECGQGRGGGHGAG